MIARFRVMYFLIAVLGAQALVTIMEDREVTVYSLPELEEIQTFSLAKRPDSYVVSL